MPVRDSDGVVVPEDEGDVLGDPDCVGVPLPERDADAVSLTDTQVVLDADVDEDADIERVQFADAE